MLLGDDPLDLLLALGAGFACGSSTRRRRPARW